MSVLFANCKKQTVSGNLDESSKASKNSPPPNQPMLSGQIVSHVDQWKRLSIGYTALFNDPTTCNNADLKIHINNLIALNQGSPARNITAYNEFIYNNFIFNKPTLGHNDLYDALTDQILNCTPPTKINNWDPSFFGSFMHLNGLANQTYYITIGMPSRIFQAQNGNLTKPAFVLPDPEVFGFPMTGYGFNPVGGGSITEFTLMDEDAYDDLIEGGTHLVLTLQLEYEYLDEKEITGNCEGGFTPNDLHSDGDCGENPQNSPSDCGDHQKNKVEYLKQIRINNDVADRRNSNKSIPLRKHWERASSNN